MLISAKKNHSEYLKMIWIDDELSEGDPHLDPFSDNHIEVDVCNSAELAKQRINAGTYDVAIIDLLMPGLSGVDLISEIIHNELPVRPVVYSGYISTNEVNNYDLLRDHEILYFDKNETSVAELASAVDDLFRKEPRTPHTNATLKKGSKQVRARSILDYSYDEFKSLSQEDRYLLVLQAEKTMKDSIDAHARKGAVWLLYGGRKEPPLVAYDFSEIPSPDEIERFCRERNIPKLQYYMNIEIDDLEWRSQCSNTLRHYPLVGLKSTSHSKALRAVHFDTGSPVTFMDKDIVTKEYGVEIDQNDDLVPFLVNGVQMGVYVKEGSFYLVDPTGVSPRISIRVHIPQKWRDCPIQNRYCTDRCRREEGLKTDQEDHPENYGHQTNVEGDKFICKHRWGLVGRNLLFETGYKFVLDGKKRLVSLLLLDGEAS